MSPLDRPHDDGGAAPAAEAVVSTAVFRRRTIEPATVVVHVEGELDMVSSPGLRAELLADPPGETTRVVLDLTDLQFLGSSGLAVLVEADEVLRERGRRLVVVHGDNRGVRRPFELVGLGGILTIVATLDEV